MWKDKVAKGVVLPIVLLVRILVGLRYRLSVKGLELLTPERLNRAGGILFLPNHPAEIDPVILESILWTKFQPRPLVVEHFYELKGFRFFMKLVKAMPLPTMDVMASRWRGKKVEKQFNAVASELQSKENFLIYPSGRLKMTGADLIGGASFVHKLVQTCPECNVVLVRIRGLWGSKFSRAPTGASPDFGKVLWECVKILLKNGIFFTPKREVEIEFALPPSDFPWQGSRLEFNKALENWYGAPEPLKLVSYAFWKEEIPSVFVPAEQPALSEERAVSKKIQQEVMEYLARLAGRPAVQIERKMHLAHDLGMDSLDVLQIYVFLDEHYQATDLRAGDLQTVEDVLQAAAGYLREREEEELPAEKQGFIWKEEKARPKPAFPEGKTLQDVFLRRVEESGSCIACVDALTAPMSYRKLKLAALILSQKFKEMPGERIGILLPSTTGAYLAILGILLARKVPVMLNWTAGVKALDHAADIADLKAVITSSKFLDRLEDGELGKIEERLHFLEEIKKGITLKDKLRALFLCMRSADSLLKKLNLAQISEKEPAVILFTSGTEALPKAVPLSHFNLLSNQRDCLEAVSLRAEDILYGVLPPFHSFGFSVTGLYPLLVGVRICYAPDPTDSHGMARAIARWKPTLFCCAPSFIKALFRVAKPEVLRTFRIIVSGAEKTPQDLFDYAKEHLPNTQLLEGYGITECSPVVTIDPLGGPHRGVGKPLAHIALNVIDPAGKAFLPAGQEGEICIAGPSVFSGYLGHPRNPFVTLERKQWYLSGDRGYIDREGYLILVGRLKRFVKIGGEMVSLGGLEEELVRLALEKQWAKAQEEGALLAVSAREQEEGKPLIVLFTIFKISKEDVNTALKECGLGRIAKISDVRFLDQIPLTGTGKTNYRLLDESLA